MKIENWNGHSIRFIEKDGEWWAVGKDVAAALGYKHTAHMFRMVDDENKGVHKVDTTSDKVKCPATQDMLIISEFGIYNAVFSSNKPEAKNFKRWVFRIIRKLRKASGLEGFQVFRMLDKDIQKEQMALIYNNIPEPSKRDYIKANTIADKAVSNKFGHAKMVKKADMSPEMLKARPKVLEDTVALMIAKERFGLDISVSEVIYQKTRGKDE